MSPSDRLKRESPERIRPIRNTLIRGGRPKPVQGSPFRGAEGLHVAEQLAAASAGAVQGAVECGVNTAYTVIEEYLHRGREAASREREQHAKRGGNMNDERFCGNNPFMVWGPMAPLIAPWIQAMQAWACAMTAFAPGAMPRDRWNRYGECAPNRYGESSPNVSVQVTSRYRTEVTTTLVPGADYMTLAATELRIVDAPPETAAAPPLNAAISSGPGPIQVRLTVPESQPPGRYRGTIVNSANGAHVGTLLVQISNP
jgi:hypothetical protein